MDAGNQDQWILDSGASQHVTNQYKLLYDKSNINEVMEMANESTEECKIKGKVKLRIDNKTNYFNRCLLPRIVKEYY